ncbi:MAG: Uncharacterized protein XD93_0052 [candidate division WS6 bacterium 34_10]|uniref:Fibronectin type-III domain-containing protein n=1 Tax=candidate division WS6 bacterium 34_10 TaxID=1641389 RepID=A0A101HJ83_9BACT|nr:MAG: Uncharacterized protein XD93_0052 [candidate division WS6 bacterium 34_10]
MSKIFAAGATPILGSATVSNTSNLIFFTSEIYGANVVISDPDSNNSNIRTISGYAWSQDIGWIEFTANTTPGVFVDYSTGQVSGSAYVMDTGNILDFDNYGSNTVVDPTTGVFTGYVWSQDVGWIHFDSDVYVKDTLAPNNVASVSGYTDDSKVKEITSSDTLVYNHTQPYFEWNTPSDPSTQSHGYQSSGVAGYYVYWGPSSTALPSASGVYQSDNSITVDVTENQTYYLRIQAVDNHGNIYTNVEEDYTFFEYHSDLTNPINVSYIVTPSGNFGNVDDMFFNWPSTPGVTSSDTNGILGWQYSLNDISSWTGSTYSDRFELDYIPFEATDYTHYFTEEKDLAHMLVGNNIIYFRTIDNAGNFSGYVTGGIAYGGLAPRFSEEAVVTVTPNYNTSNEFALSWPEVTVEDGRTVSSYYYMVNTVPPSTYSTLISNSSIYIPVGTNSVSTRKLRNAVKGNNTVYVVAVDDQNGYSPSNYITGTFELDSSLPDPVRNLSLADTSIKSAQLWRASLNWEEPTYKGDGNLSYTILRSKDGTTWEDVGTTTGLSYVDTVDSSGRYYYQVGSSDSTDESQANPTYSSVVSGTIQGRYLEPAELISGVVITGISTRKATVIWVTNRESDTKIAYGTSSNEYFEEEVYNSKQVTNHEITLNNLEPDTIYYFKAKWTDEDGNTGESHEVSFRTNTPPQVYETTVDRVGLDYAMISFEVYGATKAAVVFGENLSYTSIKELNTSPSRSSYSVLLSDLDDGTTYNYKIRLTDIDGYIYESIENNTFTTPPKPEISNVRIQELKEVASPTVLFSWQSNTKTNSIVTFRENKEGATAKDQIDKEYVSGLHEMEISGLNPQTEYIAQVEGVDEYGNRAVSESILFTTATDTRPPKISNIVVEPDLLSRSDQTDKSRSAQFVVSWETDEPATSKVEFGEGGAGLYTSSSKLDQELRTKHLVIVSGLTPSKVYSLKAVSSDSYGNVSEYGPLVSITPKSNDTIFETILGTISNIFKIF